MPLSLVPGSSVLPSLSNLPKKAARMCFFEMRIRCKPLNRFRLEPAGLHFFFGMDWNIQSGLFIHSRPGFIPLSIIMFRVTDHTQSGWLGFFRHRRENTKARQCLNRCGCNRVLCTRFENTQWRNCGIRGCRKKRLNTGTFFWQPLYRVSRICPKNKNRNPKI